MTYLNSILQIIPQLEEKIKIADIVINCAAYTNVDGAESQKELAYKVNAEATGRLGEIAQEKNIWVFISARILFLMVKGKNHIIETDSGESYKRIRQNKTGRRKTARTKRL